jgi:hypothetical protein
MGLLGRRGALAVAVGALALLVLSGCGPGGSDTGSDQDPALAALRADPLASARIPGARLADERTTNGGSSLGKPVYAQVVRDFAPTSGTVDQTLLDAAADQATQAGWTMLSLPNGHYRGTKTLDGDVRAVVNISERPSSPTLVVQLTSRD